jgi:hypothetical protein
MPSSDPITKVDLIEALQPISKRLDRIEKWLDSIETDIWEIKSDISRIDANIEIMATSQGYPYSKENRIVSAFERKVS